MPRKPPNPIDIHVGARVRMQRMLLGMSQDSLGARLGITFQQVQKYEKGDNRISASRLQQIGEILNASPAFFFAGLVDTPKARTDSPASAAHVATFLSTVEGLQLNRAFVRIGDARVRRKIVELVTALAESGTGEPTP